MSRATSSTRSVLITTALCPRLSWAWGASGTRMALSSPTLELLGREHHNCTSWAQRTVDPKLRLLRKLSFWTFCMANGEIYRTAWRKKESLLWKTVLGYHDSLRSAHAT